MKFALIADKDLFDKPVTYQIIEYTFPATTMKRIIVRKTYIFKSIQPGEMEFVQGTYLPMDYIITEEPHLIIKSLFEEF